MPVLGVPHWQRCLNVCPRADKFEYPAMPKYLDDYVLVRKPDAELSKKGIPSRDGRPYGS